MNIFIEKNSIHKLFKNVALVATLALPVIVGGGCADAAKYATQLRAARLLDGLIGKVSHEVSAILLEAVASRYPRLRPANSEAVSQTHDALADGNRSMDSCTHIVKGRIDASADAAPSFLMDIDYNSCADGRSGATQVIYYTDGDGTERLRAKFNGYKERDAFSLTGTSIGQSISRTNRRSWRFRKHRIWKSI